MLQADWDDYGVDWEGPVSLCEEDSVSVQELEEMLTDTQKVELQEQLTTHRAQMFCQEAMLQQYVTAKSYVYEKSL